MLPLRRRKVSKNRPPKLSDPITKQGGAYVSWYQDSTVNRNVLAQTAETETGNVLTVESELLLTVNTWISPT